MVIIVMGVSGSGKTTIGEMLAERLNWPFYEGDDFHSPASIAKMSAGVPLTDEDRAGWLHALAKVISTREKSGASCVIACSALKQAYRDELRAPTPQHVKFVYLKGSYALILDRMRRRKGHYMRPEMLESQFADLQEPSEALTIDIAQTPEEMVRIILDGLVGTPYR